MRKTICAMMAVAAMVILASCENDDTDFDDIIAEYQVQPVEITTDFTELDEAADIPVTDETDSAYNDYVENNSWNKVIYIDFDGETATVSGRVAGVAVVANGAHVTITNIAGPVKFVVSGTTTNGSLKFYGEKRFQLLLNGAKIVNPNGAAINNQGGKSMYVVLADGSENALVDGTSYTDVEGEDQKAALFSEGQIIFSGKGWLNVHATGRGGIRSDDYIRIRPGVKIYVNSSALDGLRANDGITIDGGIINVETSGNGAKGLRSGGPMIVNGGRTIALSHGGPRYGITDEGDSDTTACAALVCDTLLTVNAGIVKLKATGDGGKGMNAKQDVRLCGGTLQAVATGTKVVKKPKGVKVGGNFSITAGNFYAYSQRSNPLEVAGSTTVATGYSVYEQLAKSLTIAY